MVAAGVTKTSFLGVVAVPCEKLRFGIQKLNHQSSSSCTTDSCRFGKNFPIILSHQIMWADKWVDTLKLDKLPVGNFRRKTF